MKRNPEYKQEIDLKTLIFHLLYRWRSLLLAAVIGAVLLGVYQYWTVSSLHAEGRLTKDEQQYEINVVNYRNTLNNAKKNIETYQKLVAQQESREANSVWLNLDAENVWENRHIFFVQMDHDAMTTQQLSSNRDLADGIISVYSTTLLNGLDPEKMKALLGTGESRYIQELVLCEPEYEANTFTLRILGASEENVRAAMTYFTERIQTVCDDKAQALGKHTLTLLSEDVFCAADDQLSLAQKELTEEKSKNQQAIQTNQATLNKLLDSREPGRPGMHIPRFAVLGFLLGFILLGAVYLVKYIFAGVVRDDKELTGRYGLAVYGNFYRSRARRPGKGVDRWLEKLESRMGHSEDDVVLKNIAALIRENCEGGEALLTGTVSDGKLSGLKASLAPLTEGIHLSTESDFTHNAAAVTASKQTANVLLVEEKFTSLRHSVDLMAEELIINGSNVKGCIVL